MFIPFGTREKIPRHSFPTVTAFIVLINVAVFIYELYLLNSFGGAQLAGFLDDYAAVPADVTDGSPFEISLVTSMFLHAGILHIVGNMLYLMPFGDNVEDNFGHLKYLLFYMLCGLGAIATHIAFFPDSTIPVIGASGAVSGILGAYLVLHPGGVVRGLFFLWFFITTIEIPAALFIIGWFVLQLLSSTASFGSEEVGATQVAFLAHIGGFVTGLLLAFLFRQNNSRHNLLSKEI